MSLLQHFVMDNDEESDKIYLFLFANILHQRNL